MPAMSLGLGTVGKVAVGWTIIIFGGIASFAWAKNSVVKQRHELMRARQRMLRANDGNYESERKFTG